MCDHSGLSSIMWGRDPRCDRRMGAAALGRWLGGAIGAHAPHPVGFRLALRVAHDLYAWEPLSPSDDFVALGHLFTARRG